MSVWKQRECASPTLPSTPNTLSQCMYICRQLPMRIGNYFCRHPPEKIGFSEQYFFISEKVKKNKNNVDRNNCWCASAVVNRYTSTPASQVDNPCCRWSQHAQAWYKPFIGISVSKQKPPINCCQQVNRPIVCWQITSTGTVNILNCW